MRGSRNWTCPFCNRPQTLTDGQACGSSHYIPLKEHKYGEVGLSVWAFACANPACREVSVDVALTNGEGKYDNYRPKSAIQQLKLRPESFAKPQPEFIPKALRDDYLQACRIRDLSPRASATLARRCLQGLIRHFCGISKSRLIDEITALRDAVESGKAPRGVTIESIDAIDHVRKIGNIGAHMERDVDLLIDIDAGEAQALIELIEMLFDEWYVEQHNRVERLKKIAKIGAEKSAAKNLKAKVEENEAGGSQD